MHYADAAGRLDNARRLLADYPADWVRGRRCLDVGCGSGNMLLAMAELGAAEAVGVDVNLLEFGETHFHRLAADQRIDVSRASFREGLLGAVGLPPESFDLVTLCDVIEHAADPAGLVADLRRVLRPGGRLLLDVSPLYYAPVGHHLWQYYPRETMPWRHLWHDFDPAAEAARLDPWLWGHFLGLSRITRSEVDALLAGAGFVVRDTHHDGRMIPGYTVLTAGEDQYEAFADRIDFARVPAVEDLFVQRLTLVAVKHSLAPERTTGRRRFVTPTRVVSPAP